MRERTNLIATIRAEVVGPGRPDHEPTMVRFADRVFIDDLANRRGAAVWETPEGELEEVLYYERESPYRKYGAGLLHPDGIIDANIQATGGPASPVDALGADPEQGDEDGSAAEDENGEGDQIAAETTAGEEEFEVMSADVRHPSSIGITFCVALRPDGRVTVELPTQKHLSWQEAGDRAMPVNGRYEQCVRRWTDDRGGPREAPVWRRRGATNSESRVVLSRDDLAAGRVVSRQVPMRAGSPISLTVQAFPRLIRGREDAWLLTLVLRNKTQLAATANLRTAREATLYQSYFDVAVESGSLEPYPESERPFDQLDEEEQSLVLLYRESVTWGIGHGCAAGWDGGPGDSPSRLWADIMPAVETPSTTPDIVAANGQPIQLSMREMAGLPDTGVGVAWDRLGDLAKAYEAWIADRRREAAELPDDLRAVAGRHLLRCDAALGRIRSGIARLQNDAQCRQAFRLANISMLLQQIATKQLPKRPLVWDASGRRARPSGESTSPWAIFSSNAERPELGRWRAFQIAFLLMQLDSASDGRSPDRDLVDLIWFPTGGGKTEAYLAVMAYYMFHERLRISDPVSGPARDGTNVLMRYTLRMLTTQQFQRAASLICAMEFIRRHPDLTAVQPIPGARFSLGLWIGQDGTPNSIRAARAALSRFADSGHGANPLVLTECSWCRASIGRYDRPIPPGIPAIARVTGIVDDHGPEGPRLVCSDPHCDYGQEAASQWLPIEVIDERIYAKTPSLVIATADKFAMLAYRPDAGSLFGRHLVNGTPEQTHLPPGLIIQDELHLIAGPLGTMYGLYEGVIERLCSHSEGATVVKPKLIASTATIRGAADQTKAIYGRVDASGAAMVELFPSPGLRMSNSFFGVYARRSDGTLESGRQYVGVHANDYGSILTTQVRAFAAALYAPTTTAPAERDAWWSLLAFYNSLRELGGAKTLFDSDIRSRLKFLQNRENVPPDKRRNLRIVEELTSRLSQSEIVMMLDRLATQYSVSNNAAVDACLASSIIEVGVDIDRLSLMGVVGQPKSTAQYIQVTGRVGRRWWERPGLVLMIYSPAKSRDRSHFEQFQSYHTRLYERVEPTSATPFAPAAIRRGLCGALIAWARQQSRADVQEYHEYAASVNEAFALLKQRCEVVQVPEDVGRSVREMELVRDELIARWNGNPQKWEEFPPSPTEEYLMLWPGQFATRAQTAAGVEVPSSMRQVDGSAELTITQGYPTVV